MGQLQSEGTRERHRLLAHTRIGRATENELRLLDPWVSSIHASLSWNAEAGWEVRDLGSRNGTYVDGARLAEGARRPVRQGARLAFGDRSRLWLLEDASPPIASARNLETKELVWCEDQLLALRANDGTEVSIYRDARGRWTAELSGEPQPVDDGACLTVASERWLLSLPGGMAPTEALPTLGGTQNAGPLGGASLRFVVSADQEYVVVSAVIAGEERWRSDRTYAQALLALARARVEDQSSDSLEESEHGWVYADDLCRGLGYSDVMRLNVEIHRARTELARAGIEAPACVVERRRGTGQLRIGTGSLELPPALRSVPQTSPRIAASSTR